MKVEEASVALVTGASSGIGRAAAIAFARAGYNVVIADVHEDQGREVAAECEREGATCATRSKMRRIGSLLPTMFSKL